jgi:hypothetical protein
VFLRPSFGRLTAVEVLESDFGSVYLLKGPGSRYKIGKTNAFGRRKRELSIQLPFDIRKIHVVETDDPSGVEAYWHQRFGAKRINSEWFELNNEDVAAFKMEAFEVGCPTRAGADGATLRCRAAAQR